MSIDTRLQAAWPRTRMSRLRSARGTGCQWSAGIFGLLFASVLAGCGAVIPSPIVPGTGDSFEDGNVDPGAVSNKGRTRGEPNDSFDSALIAVFNGSDTAFLQGSIATLGDLDVFDLGPLEPGDRVAVDADTGDSLLDVSIALFDADELLFIDNDDRGVEPRLLDSLVDEIVRHASDPYYLVVGASTFAGGRDQSLGTYRATVSIERGGRSPAPAPQTLLLDFDGGTVDAQNIPVSSVRAFDAGDIAAQYAGDTDLMKSVITATVRENYQRFAVDVVTSDDPPPQGPFSTILFGGRSPIAFGISGVVDHYNADQEDVAVIFTESFSPRVFTTPPTAEELGVAIGNVAAHEAGHLLGLNHVNDPTDLMDAVSPADTFLEDQEFKRSPLSEQILPIGFQDALLLLAEIVGLR